MKWSLDIRLYKNNDINIRVKTPINGPELITWNFFVNVCSNISIKFFISIIIKLLISLILSVKHIYLIEGFIFTPLYYIIKFNLLFITLELIQIYIFKLNI